MTTLINTKSTTEQVIQDLKKTISNYSNLVETINLIDREIAILENHELEGKSIDKLRDIQCLIDKAKEIESNTDRLDVYKEFNSFISRIKEIIENLKSLRNTYNASIPKEVSEDLHKIINERKDKITSLNEILAFINLRINSFNSCIIPELNENSNKDTFKIWAEKLELFAEGLEECLKIMPGIPLGLIEDIAINLLLVSKNLKYSEGKREHFRRRVRNAASFILNIAKKSRLDLLNNESAEIKAIERINKKEEETEWITYLEPGESINMEELTNLL